MRISNVASQNFGALKIKASSENLQLLPPSEIRRLQIVGRGAKNHKHVDIILNNHNIEMHEVFHDHKVTSCGFIDPTNGLQVLSRDGEFDSDSYSPLRFSLLTIGNSPIIMTSTTGRPFEIRCKNYKDATRILDDINAAAGVNRSYKIANLIEQYKAGKIKYEEESAESLYKQEMDRHEKLYEFGRSKFAFPNYSIADCYDIYLHSKGYRWHDVRAHMRIKERLNLTEKQLEKLAKDVWALLDEYGVK